MSIKCGHCGDYHDSVAGVRACYAGKYGPPVPGWDGESATARPTTAAASEPAATEKQLAYIDTLRGERDLDASTGTMTKRESSAEITRLLAMPIPASRIAAFKPNSDRFAGMDVSGVKEGRYAIDIDGTVKFYKVDKPTEGRWSGYTFVKVQASDDLWPVRGASATAVLALIAKDPQGAMLRYGKEIGRCGHCNRTLTNELSRERGIGPVCYGRMDGWMDIALFGDDADDEAPGIDPIEAWKKD